MKADLPTREHQRLNQQYAGTHDWYLWGPYLAERAWGTVREDYSANGEAWEYFGFEQAHARAYRWNEDGLGGISDKLQRLCFSVGLWNGVDPILKERAFGLTNAQGNRGEEVKEYYFYLDGSPSHSWLRYLYKYPQSKFPYQQIIDENASRDRHQAPFGLLDTGVFSNGHWDVEVSYAKAGPEDIYIRIRATNCGPQRAALHVLPTLWLRNTWAWSNQDQPGNIQLVPGPNPWQVRVPLNGQGDYCLSGRTASSLLFTDNESNSELIWGRAGARYSKDGFHRLLIEGETGAVRPDEQGSKMAALTIIETEPGESQHIDLRLCRQDLAGDFAGMERIIAARRSENDVFLDQLQPQATTEDHRILRQVAAGMIWTKQFYHYDVNRWLEGDRIKPPVQRQQGRNRHWRHLDAADIFSMPDCWEYPWFAAWDLAYHCAPLAMLDSGFAKQQLELLLSSRYLHPTGQIPAYEWNFSDVNPPVHAAFVLRVFRAEKMTRGQADYGFLRRCFHKLLLNYSWWLNRKDDDGQNLFSGGFLGLDNISVFDRSHSPLPDGYRLLQADATGWMAMYALNMTVIALELATQSKDYVEMAIQSYQQFLAIAESIRGYDPVGVSLWDADDGFFKDAVVAPDGQVHHIDVYSWVGLIPLFACEVIGPELLAAAPEFAAILEAHRGGQQHGHFITQCPDTGNERGEHLLALVDQAMLARILNRVLDEKQFLSRYGIRSMSQAHDGKRPVGNIPGIGPVHIEYSPGEAQSPMYGGNSNWRGPIWLPTNYSFIQALERYSRYLGDQWRVSVPAFEQPVNLSEAVGLVSDRVVDLYRRNSDGRIPALRPDSPFQSDPQWSDLCLFYEYFHADTGRGLGAAHQTGWTGLLANLVMRRYRD